MDFRETLASLLPAAGVISDLAHLFSRAGHRLYLVGGSVRDALMGVVGNDLDFTTDARPDVTHRLLDGWADNVWDIGKEFGTISALKTAEAAAWQIEITTFRSDDYHPDSRKPDVVYGETIEEDLSRRDFTVNAIALDVTDGSIDSWRIVDPFDGTEDIADQILRTPSSPEISFSDDPLRMMRAARFASQLGFIIEPGTARAIAEMSSRLDIVSAERVRDEFSKLLLTDAPRAGLNVMTDLGLADVVVPELADLRDTQDEHNRHKDIYEHTLTVLDQAIQLEYARDFVNGQPNPDHQPDLIVRLAALFHDIGKPATRRYVGGKVTFHHHDVVGARMTRSRLRELRYPKDVVKAVTQLVDQHLRFHGYAEGSSGGASSGWTDSAVRRYVRDAGDQLERLHILTRADCTTRNVRKAERLRRAYDELEYRIDELAAQEELDAIRPELDGNQIMQILGIPAGPEVGKAYNYLLERRISDGPVGQEKATELLLEWWEN